MTINIIGIDCATDPKKVGLALGEYDQGRVIVKQIKKPERGETVVDALMWWLDGDNPYLLAIDAPLGWPLALGEQSIKHNAGCSLSADSNRMFRRHTDLCVKEITGKQPLDVGADRIARTAHSALSILEELREKTGQDIPLAWNTNLKSNIAAIEVYPAATLKMSGIRSSGYKKPDDIKQRIEIIHSLEKFVDLNHILVNEDETDSLLLEKDNDVLDAVVCVLAGSDFLSDKCVQPGDIELAKKEGWIWVLYQNRMKMDYKFSDIP